MAVCVLYLLPYPSIDLLTNSHRVVITFDILGAGARAALRASGGEAPPQDTAPNANESHADEEMEE